MARFGRRLGSVILLDAHDDCVRRRVDMEADDVADRHLQVRVGGER
jgi:hypothetical protein